jgi:hypothetical protein
MDAVMPWGGLIESGEKWRMSIYTLTEF